MAASFNSISCSLRVFLYWMFSVWVLLFLLKDNWNLLELRLVNKWVALVFQHLLVVKWPYSSARLYTKKEYHWRVPWPEKVMEFYILRDSPQKQNQPVNILNFHSWWYYKTAIISWLYEFMFLCPRCTGVWERCTCSCLAKPWRTSSGPDSDTVGHVWSQSSLPASLSTDLPHPSSC